MARTNHRFAWLGPIIVLHGPHSYDLCVYGLHSFGLHRPAESLFACIGMAYLFMAYMVMAYIVLACTGQLEVCLRV